MDKDLIRKLLDEHPLTAEESLRLDGALEGARSQFVAQAVGGLEDETPSLAWRSRLNETLVKASKRRRVAQFWRLGFGATALAAACFMVLTLMNPEVPGETPKSRPVASQPHKESVEDAILSGHQDAINEASLGVNIAYNSSGN